MWEARLNEIETLCSIILIPTLYFNLYFKIHCLIQLMLMPLMTSGKMRSWSTSQGDGGAMWKTLKCEVWVTRRLQDPEKWEGGTDYFFTGFYIKNYKIYIKSLLRNFDEHLSCSSDFVRDVMILLILEYSTQI